MYTEPEYSAFYNHFQMTSGEMTSLRGHFRSREARGHFLLRDCHLL